MSGFNAQAVLDAAARLMDPLSKQFKAWWQGDATTTVNNGIADLPSPAKVIADLQSSVPTATAAAASAVAALASFQEAWQGALAADPVLAADGTALRSGALYFCTTGTPKLRIFDGVVWNDYDLTVQQALAIKLIYPTTAAGVSTGITSVTRTNNGSGGTNGTFSVNVPGFGPGGTQATISFTVASGAISAASVATPGSNFPSAPIVLSGTTLSALSAGLTGAVLTLQPGGGAQFGQVFGVSSPTTTGAVDLYTNVAGVATTTGQSLASSAGFSAEVSARTAGDRTTAGPATLLNAIVTYFSPRNANGWKWVVRDLAGYVAAYIDSANYFIANFKSSVYAVGNDGFLRALSRRASGMAWAVYDGAGNIVGGFSVIGTFLAKSAKITNLTVQTLTVGNGISTSKYSVPYGVDFGNADCEFWTEYGQSNAVGDFATPPISTTQRYNDLGFNGGAITQVSPTSVGTQLTPQSAIDANRVSLIPLTETISGRETPVSGFTSGVHDMILLDNSLRYTQYPFGFIASASGVGGRHIAELVKNGTSSGSPNTFYTNFLADLSAAYSLASAAGRVLVSRAWGFIQGEADAFAVQATYASAFDAMVTQADIDIRAITGQTDSVHCISWQVCGEQQSNGAGWAGVPSVAYAQKQVGESNPLCHIACPHYFMPYTTGNNLHLSNYSSKWLGYYQAICYKRVVFDKAAWRPLSPVLSNPILRGAPGSKSRIVQFDVPVAPLVFDTSQVAPASDGMMGFALFQSDGVTPVTLTGVQIVGPKLVKVTAAVAITSGMILRYGKTDVAAPGTSTQLNATGLRGNLRDSQGAAITFSDGVNTYVMNNWCLLFQLTIP